MHKWIFPATSYETVSRCRRPLTRWAPFHWSPVKRCSTNWFERWKSRLAFHANLISVERMRTPDSILGPPGRRYMGIETNVLVLLGPFWLEDLRPHLRPLVSYEKHNQFTDSICFDGQRISTDVLLKHFISNYWFDPERISADATLWFGIQSEMT